MPDVAILHDQFDSRGGAERVAVELARTFDAPIYAAFVDDDVVPDDVELHELFTSRTARFVRNRHYLVTDAYHMHAWQQVSEPTDHDVVIVNKNNAGWYVPTDEQATVWYLHSTPRNLYDRFHDLRRGPIKRWLCAAQRALYAPNVRYADYWVCNSDPVARRLDRYWDRDADAVVYPPVPTSEYDPADATTLGYFVTVGRLRRHKRTLEVVRAANRASAPLKVVGDGRMRADLEAEAGPTVDVLGYVSEARKRELLAGAKAFVMFAENEDFGMAPVEAMAAGTPVVGVDEGFTRYQIREGHNGVLVEPDVGALAATLASFDPLDLRWGENAIAAWARRTFGRDQFRAGIREAVRSALERASVTPAWERTDGEVGADSVPVDEVGADGGGDP